MKNKSIWMMGVVVIVLMVLAAVITVVVVSSQKTSAPKSSSNTAIKTTYHPPSACDILTLEFAQKVATGVASSDVPTPDVSSDSINVSNCNYYDIVSKVSVGLLVRGAKDETGAQTNKAQFDTLPADTQSVSGYGDKAYWDPTFGQLNILKNHNWYILSSGPVIPANRTLEASKKLADVIINKL